VRILVSKTSSQNSASSKGRRLRTSKMYGPAPGSAPFLASFARSGIPRSTSLLRFMHRTTSARPCISTGVDILHNFSASPSQSLQRPATPG
jgi:hypothetical protein